MIFLHKDSENSDFTIQKSTAQSTLRPRLLNALYEHQTVGLRYPVTQFKIVFLYLRINYPQTFEYVMNRFIETNTCLPIFHKHWTIFQPPLEYYLLSAEGANSHLQTQTDKGRCGKGHSQSRDCRSSPHIQSKAMPDENLYLYLSSNVLVTCPQTNE